MRKNVLGCHGDGGRGATTTQGPAISPVGQRPKRKGIDGSTSTIANFWPYAPPLFGYIRAAMPWNEPRSLTDHEVYALTAYILAENKLIDARQVMNARTLPKVLMPNRNGSWFPAFSQKAHHMTRPGIRIGARLGSSVLLVGLVPAIAHGADRPDWAFPVTDKIQPPTLANESDPKPPPGEHQVLHTQTN